VVQPNTEGFLDSVREVCSQVWGQEALEGSEIETKHLTLGITNQLFAVFVKPKKQGASPKSMLIRIFGAEGIIDRSIENALFASLAAVGIAPGYLGRFANGRCEEFLDGWANLGNADIRKPNISRVVAAKLAEVHAFSVPPPLQKHFDSTCSGVWSQLGSWIDVLEKTPVQDEAIADSLNQFYDKYFGGTGFPTLRARVKQLQEMAPKDAQIVFSHNDLLAFNIMRRCSNVTEGQDGVDDAETEARSNPSGASRDEELGLSDIKLIDYEYGCYNYRGFDVANHFCEWAGGSDDAKPLYEHFPTPEQQRLFCESYIDACAALGIQSRDRVKLDSSDSELEQAESELDKLLREVSFFVQVVHIYWTVWALNQARDEGIEGFDYISYAHRRFSEGLRRRTM